MRALKKLRKWVKEDIMSLFEVYTDGACTNNQGEGLQPGGWAAVFVDGPALSGGESATTNNRMEMRAVIEALKNTPPHSHVRIYSDSAYVINCFNQKWIDKWEKNGWMTSSKKPVENKDLWLEMRQLEKERQVEWIKVKGHSGNQWNEMADTLAVAAIPKDKNNDDQSRKEICLYLTQDEKINLLSFLDCNQLNLNDVLKNVLVKLQKLE
ncbi:MAG: ribonuclease [Epulopiscium sp.]|jgi:ribonuclease HI|nr:ribonuclease [Defluviitaleaceae bacterium]MDK2789253.1 ribonuclease [Candidatus Epulonipiscium sp.]